MDEIRDPQFKTPDGSALRMWRDTATNRFLSGKHGRPYFDEVLLVEVISPGSRDSTPVFELERIFAAEMEHPEPLRSQKYFELEQYVKQFESLESVDGTLSGTPLEQWPELSRSMVASLKAQNIFTVDALASLPDTKLIAVGPDGRTWREKAKAYIDNASGSAVATALAAELEQSRQDLAAAQANIATLAGQVSALQTQLAVGGAPAAPQAAKPGKVVSGKADTPTDPLAAPNADPLAAPDVDPLAPAPPAAPII